MNITGAIAAQQGLLRTYGGHPMAAGLSLDAENIERFRTDLAATVRAMPYDASTAEKLPIDGCLQLGEITIDLAEQFAQLGPFGSGNPPLTFCARNVIVKSERTLGKIVGSIPQRNRRTPELIQGFSVYTRHCCVC